MEYSGNVFRHGGIESRPFLFAQETESISAADDGGLIEIRVFRAKEERGDCPIWRSSDLKISMESSKFFWLTEPIYSSSPINLILKISVYLALDW